MLLNIFLKEIKDCFRDRRTLLLTVLLPVIMMTGLTFFYENMISDNGDEKYRLAVSESMNQDLKGIFTGFKNIDLVEAADPEAALEDGKAEAALLLGKSFSSQISTGEKAKVTIVGDTSSQKSSVLSSMVQTALSVYEKSIIAQRMQANGSDPSLVEPLEIQQREMADQNENTTLLAMLIPLILSIAIGIGSSPAAADLFAGEKERKTMEALLITPVKRSTLLFSKWLTIATVGTVTGIVTLAVVVVEIQMLTEHLKKALSFGDQTFTIIGLAVLVSVIYAMFNASLLMLASIFGKTVKEAQSYSTPVLMLAMFPAMGLSSKGINELSFQHFAIPIMNLFSLLKELVFGIVDYQHILIALTSNLICMIVLFIIGRMMFLKDKWVMN
ncbi:ABC transporter permease [Neobacillus dielmonensis]|uniref:ABC transporter permease n=1 Tax=Neobacillus dielmonensis TaxID=1347369 RepID=UPI0005AAD990|nr:ABC transporter permease [Neobacillus dielmonensis]